MMTKKAISLISLLIISGIAHATTTPTLQTKWSGFYGGINADALFNHVNLHANNAGLTKMSGTCNESTNFSSFSPGAQLGFVHQYHSNIVLGIEGGLNYNANQKENLNCTCPINPGVSDHFSFYNRAQGSLLGRIGYALMNNSLLPFITAGGSLANLGLKYYNENGDQYNTNPTTAGWIVGTGVEWRMASAWSLRAEYYYVSYSNVNMHINTIYGLTDPNGGAHAGLYTNNVAVAINYWF